ncbi:sulfatase [Ravibacter arvi]|uniref:Sulfatase n=2 Tax=Ravibacter arvi TaxID=2051041 RepID=A0ABP8LUC7_9BACT
MLNDSYLIKTMKYLRLNLQEWFAGAAVWRVLFASICAGILPGTIVAQAEKRPNILWIVANDIGNELGCYGNKLIHTPNLDRLAGKGVAYRNMITAGAVCSPSRSAFITGMHAVSINCHNQFPNKKTKLPDGITPLPLLMKAGGYYVANTGGVAMKGPYYTGYNFEHDPAALYDGFDWSGRKEGQPFFAQVHLKLSHRPFERDPERPINPDKVVVPPYYPNHPMARQDWAMYLETVQLLDKQVGAILQRLKDNGLEDNTVVFFFGDHGHPHIRGKQFLYDGGVNAPLIVAGPGIRKSGVSDRLVSNTDLAAATLSLAGLRVPAFMQGRDFLQENSVPNTYVFSSRDRCDETLDRIRMVRTREFKLIRNYFPERPYTQFNAYKKTSYPVLTLMQVLKKRGELTPVQAHFMADTRPEYELYDLRKDPFETKNLAGDPSYAKQLNTLKQVLENWLAETDKGPYPESAEEVSFARAKMQKMYDDQLTAAGLPKEVTDEQYLAYWEAVFRRFFPVKEH